MKRICLAFALMVLAGPGAQASDAYERAEAAIRGFRAETYLPTPCEQAFAAFWRVFSDGERALVYEVTPWGAREYFGYGNPASEPLLVDARDICADQIGASARMILVVLRDRARAKERYLRRNRHAERFIVR